MWAADALRQVERTLHADVLALECFLAAAFALPHLEASLNGLLQQVESVASRFGERDAQAGRLLRIVPGSDSEHRAPAGQHVECRHNLREQAGRPVGDRRRQGEQADASGVGRDKAQRRVCLDMVLQRTTDDGVHPEMVGDRYPIEAGSLSRLDDLAKERAQARRPALPVGVDDVNAQLHGISSEAGRWISLITPRLRWCCCGS